MDRAFEVVLRTVGRGVDLTISQYLGLNFSVANKTWQIYKANQNKVIDKKKIMLTLQNVADVIKN